jgi:F-type H+-transporting ATPase subunit alpha
MRAKHADVLATIRDERELSSATDDKLKAILDDFAKTFV